MSMTPDGRSQVKQEIDITVKKPGSNSEILTPSGTKPFITAFCPKTHLIDNYPSKHLSM